MSHANYLAGKVHAEGDKNFVQVPISIPDRCDHVTHVCTKCIDSWELDWTFYFDRTVPGRRMKEILGRTQ